MAVYHRAYLFDIDGCSKVIRPIVSRLASGDTEALRATATRIAKRKPEIWSLLADYRLHQDDLGSEEREFDTIESRVRFWMMVVFASFWQPVETPPDYARAVDRAIRQFADDEKLINMLSVGRPLCTLLHSELVLDLETHQHIDDDWPFWCRLGLTGWLDSDDIHDLLERLLPLQDFFTKGAGAEYHDVYQAAWRLLSIAHQSGRGLFLAIVD